MPVLSVKAVAAAAGKDPKTLRLWCERGLVPGAVRRAGGRHWRISGRSAETVAAEAHQRAAGFSRRRPKDHETSGLRLLKPMNEMLKEMKELNRALGRGLPQILIAPDRKQRMASKYICMVADVLMGKSKDELELLGLPESAVRKLAFIPLASKFAQTATIGAVCVWIIEGGNGSRAAAARCAGISRRSFMRVFGRYWPQAKRFVDEVTEQRPDVVSGWQQKGKDERTGKSIGERVPVVLPADATDKEKRAWTAAVSSTKELPED